MLLRVCLVWYCADGRTGGAPPLCNRTRTPAIRGAGRSSACWSSACSSSCSTTPSSTSRCGPSPTRCTASAPARAELEWAINSYTLVFAGLLFTAGVLGDRLGRRRHPAHRPGAVRPRLARSRRTRRHPGQLIWARALMGIGGAADHAGRPCRSSPTSSTRGSAARPSASGPARSASAVAIGPIVGGVLLEHFWWGSVFLINVPIVVVGLIADRAAGARVARPEAGPDRPGRRAAVDRRPGRAGLRHHRRRRARLRPAAVVGPPSLGGVAVLAAFVVYERRIDHPSLDVRLFRNPRFSAAVGVGRPGLLRRHGHDVLLRLLPAAGPRLHARCRPAC